MFCFDAVLQIAELAGCALAPELQIGRCYLAGLEPEEWHQEPRFTLCSLRSLWLGCLQE